MIMLWKSSIGSELFRKLHFLVVFLKNRKSSKNDKFVDDGAPALRVIRAGTRLTVYRALLWLVELTPVALKSNTGAPLASWNPKNVELFIIFEVFLSEVMHSFIMKNAVGIFRGSSWKIMPMRRHYMNLLDES